MLDNSLTSVMPDAYTAATAEAGPTLMELRDVLGQAAPRELFDQLARRGVLTLADVRRAGHVSHLAGDAERDGARLVEAHADLARLSPDITANAAVIAAGFSSTSAIARAARADFLAAAAPAIGVEAAVRLHVEATALSRALDQLLVGVRVDADHGVLDGLPTSVVAAVHDGVPQRCKCSACEAAPSPAAYLADLLAYVIQHLRDRHQPISLPFLVGRFHQPFGDLPTDCEAVDRPVREVRICCEVLRSVLAVEPPSASRAAALADAEQAYRLSAYEGVLTMLGTTFEELRVARRATLEVRQELAARLGLPFDPLTAARPDALDALLLNPDAAPSAPDALSERALERLFGLADTTRNPLSDGSALRDPTPLITRWNLSGVIWGRNTDPDGLIHVVLSHDGPTFFRVALYQDAARSKLVAAGEQHIAGGVVAGIITVVEENASGLSGRFELASPTDDATIALTAIPQVTAWRLQMLRLAWELADHADDAFRDGVSVASLAAFPAGVSIPPGLAGRLRFDTGAHLLILDGVLAPGDRAQLVALAADPVYLAAVNELYVASQRRPVIDPNVLGPDDFRVPVAKKSAGDPDKPFDLWLRRRDWVDARLDALSAITKVVKGNTVPDFDGALAAMYVPVAYGTDTLAPWEATTPVTALETIWEEIGEGVSVPAHRRRLAADLGLELDAFSRLIALRHADAAAALDPRLPPLSDAEWREFYSLLAAAAKQRFAAAWREEERVAAVVFGAEAFVVSLREPAVGLWPPVRAATQPLIDPALVSPADLPEPGAGARALDFWRQRATRLDQITRTLRTIRESAGLEAMLREALGDPAAGDPLPVNVDVLAQQLVDPNPTIRAAAATTVRAKLFLSVDDFTRVMAVRAADADPNPLAKPTPADWLDVYAILTQAEKEKREYPTWLTEEASPTTGVVYWTARKATLPPWRSSVDQRAHWHEALAQRTATPIVEPDLVSPLDLVDPAPGHIAFDVWQARDSWMQSLLGGSPPTTVAAFDIGLTTALGVDSAALVAIGAERDAGNDVRARLAQLGLTLPAFDRLLAVRAVLDGGLTVLASEWDDATSILAQATKQRRYAVWREEERAQHIILGPDLFQLPSEPAEGGSVSPPLPPWRATVEGRDAWLDVLRARVEQRETTVSAVADAMDAAEGNTLSSLRDALVLATDAPGSDLITKADWLTTNLMIDARTAPCQKTTRIEQAIETLQTAMTGVRDGQIGAFEISLASAPAAVAAWGPGRFDVFVRGGDNAVWHRVWDGAWQDWESLGGIVTSAPAATSAGAETIELFARGTDNALWHRTYTAGSWTAWESLGGVIASGPAATSPAVGRIDVVAVGLDGGLWRRIASGGGWGPWTPVARTAPLPAGGIAGSPALVSSTPSSLDAFARGADGALWHVAADAAGTWSGWESLGGYITSDPAAASSTAAGIAVFARGGDMAVWERAWQSGSGWTPWSSLGGFTLQGPAAASWGGGRLDVVAEGPDSSLWRVWFDGAWHPWEAVDELTIDAPDFDEEWKWMGSYATWRAAILVFMYPQHLLDGRLRKRQSPGYQKLVAYVQGNRALTPAQARDAACEYSNYYRDVCSITVETSCRVWSRLDEGVGCIEATNPRRGWLLDMFGRAAHSNRAYWSSYDELETSGYPQSFWDVVPGLDGQHLVGLSGSAPFWVSAGKRYVFLFFIALDRGARRLRFTRYDPEVRGQNGWEQVIYELALRPEWGNFTARLGYQAGEGDPPRVIITLPDGSSYGRQLNREGTDWSVVDWARLGIWMPWTHAVDAPVMSGTPLSVVSRFPDQLDLFWSDMTGAVFSIWVNAYANDGRLNPPFRIDNAYSGGGTISAVARTPDHLDLFVVDGGGTVLNTWWDAGADDAKWHAFAPISPPNTARKGSVVAAVSRNPNFLDLFVVGPDDRVYSTWWDGSWHPWFPIGDPTYTTWDDRVYAAARGPNHLDVIMIDTKGRLRHNLWDGASGTPWSATWTSFAQSGFTVDPEQSKVALVTSTPTRLDVLVNGGIRADGTALTFWNWTDFTVDIGIWHSFISVSSKSPARFAAAVTAVGRFPTQLDVFTTGQRPAGPGGATTIWSAWRNSNVDGGSWHDWFSIGDDGGDIKNTGPWGPVAAISRFPSRIELFSPLFGGSTSTPGAIYTTYWQDSEAATPAPQLPPFSPVPKVSGPLDIPDHLTSPELQLRRAAIALAFAANAGAPHSTLCYLEEGYYFVPMLLAGQLQRVGEYVAALDWYRTVYDYSMPVELRNIYYGFELEKSLPAVGSRLPDWLLDPLNPHLIAATRRYAYARYTILQIAQCFLEYGDARFTVDTAESDAQARTLYMTALRLLSLDIFEQSSFPCEGLLIRLGDTTITDPKWKWVIHALKYEVAKIEHQTVAARLVERLQSTLAGDASWPAKLRTAWGELQNARREIHPAPTVADVIAFRERLRDAAHADLLANPGLGDVVSRVPVAAAADFDASTRTMLEARENGHAPVLDRQRLDGEHAHVPQPPAQEQPQTTYRRPPFSYVISAEARHRPPQPPPAPAAPMVTFWFCTPPDPLLAARRAHAELNLYKLRNCMNIAGIHRQVDPYAAPTDVASGLPSIGAGGQLVIPGAVVLQPTPYHYDFLIDRSKQLVQIAGQVEAAMQAAMESSERAAYDELKARQDVALARATVQLQDLRVKQAGDAVTLAELQRERATVQTTHWQTLLDGGESDLEQAALDAMYTEAGLQVASAALSTAAAVQSGFSPQGAFSFGASSSANTAAALSTLGQSFGTMAAIFQARASYERRREDWEYQRSLGVEDQRIAAAQVASAQDQLRVVGQERNIAQLQADHSVAVLDFLTHKFFNPELYEWMSAVLQQVYSFFLHQATAVARLAEVQLAFQRQEVALGYIKADYWADPPAASGNATGPADTRGLTGSARLLQDIYALDQYAIDTNKRKLQLSKTVSLAQLDPIEFQRLRTTGVMQFATPMALFDRDFPGHYVRLVHRVRTSVVALIPPTQGIRATLSTTGATRVVIGPEVFQKTVVRRDPQTVALSGPSNATGVFELDPQSELLLPLEGLGVEGHFEFRFPKPSNAIDYQSLADVLITFEYTALHNADYAVEVARTLGTHASAERPFSFRNELADQWYDFHNPDQSATPMTVAFTTTRDDFPPNLADLRIEQLLLGFVRADGATFEVPVRALQFIEEGSTARVGGAATSFGGLIGTRRGNAASWTSILGKSPFGLWTLQLPNTAVARSWFAEDRIADVLFVITYGGRTPEWPA